MKEEKKFYTKWWFGLVLLAIVIVIGIIIIMIMAFNTIRGEGDYLSSRVQKIYADAKVYDSILNRTLILELNNWDNQNKEKFAEIFGIIKEEAGKGMLQSYDKLITLSYIKSNNKENTLFIKQVYNLPDFANDSTVEYIDFDEYQNMYNTLNKTMDGYTNLFESIN